MFQSPWTAVIQQGASCRHQSHKSWMQAGSWMYSSQYVAHPGSRPAHSTATMLTASDERGDAVQHSTTGHVIGCDEVKNVSAGVATSSCGRLLDSTEQSVHYANRRLHDPQAGVAWIIHRRWIVIPVDSNCHTSRGLSGLDCTKCSTRKCTMRRIWVDSR
jgi:hypothetical protein